ncbi:hypothetical protein Tcan_00495, partial [Toxocara canis]
MFPARWGRPARETGVPDADVGGTGCCGGTFAEVRACCWMMRSSSRCSRRVARSSYFLSKICSMAWEAMGFPRLSSNLFLIATVISPVSADSSRTVAEVRRRAKGPRCDERRAEKSVYCGA